MKITLCGLAGVGTSSAGKAIANPPKWPFVSAGDYFRDIAVQESITHTELERRSRQDFKYDKEIDRRTVRFGEDNRDTGFVFDGRLAWYFIPYSFKILLTCDFDTRVDRVARRDRVPFDTAQSLTLEREEIARERYGALYGLSDFDDPKHFDIVVDTTANTQDEVATHLLDAWVNHPRPFK